MAKLPNHSSGVVGKHVIRLGLILLLFSVLFSLLLWTEIPISLLGWLFSFDLDWWYLLPTVNTIPFGYFTWCCMGCSYLMHRVGFLLFIKY